jgi:molybdopterin-dependent oxidoreductase alpha subunit
MGSTKSSRNWISLIPYGLNQQHPNNYKDILAALWENRDNLGYAWRVLNNGCCDGCSLGTTGMRDWTMKGVHLCAVRLQMLRFNTMPAMDWRILEDVAPLQNKTEKQLRKLGRLAVPMLRRKGEKGFHRVTWDEALTLIADKVRATDPQRIGWYLTSRGLTNEAYYAHQKVARFIGTNHVDTSARICHAPSTAALTATVGCAATTCSYSDWIGADLIVFVGSNVANNQPVTTKYLYYAKKAGTRVFVVNPYQEPGMERYWIPSVAESALFGTRIADDFFQVHIGGDIPFFYGVLKHLVENNWIDRDFIQARTAGWPELETNVRSLEWDSLESGSGLSRAEMLRFAEAFGKARHAIVVWSMGITQHRYGSDNVRALVNLQLARGNVGRPHTGLMPIRGHSGVQGGAEMGAQPGAYLMGFPASAENARKFAAPEIWGFEPPAWKGLNAAHMIAAAGRGEIDVLWQSGGNFKHTLPEPEQVARALGNIRLRVHQDIVVNPTMLIDPAETAVLLPTRTRYEQRGGGTETSTERRIIFSPQIAGGPGLPEAKDEWEIPVLVAHKLDPERSRNFFAWKDTQDIRNEIDRLCPVYKGIAGLKKKGDNFQYGGPRLLADRFLTPDGKGHFSVVDLPKEDRPNKALPKEDLLKKALPNEAQPEEKVPSGRFLLASRRGKQFNSIIHAQLDPITGARRDAVLMAREDAEELGLNDGDAITLRNPLGEFHGRVKIDRVKPGSLQAHWPEINILIPAGRLDPSGVPDYNATVEVVPTRLGQR